MSTATLTSQTDALQQLTDLQKKADEEQSRHRDELSRHETTMNTLFAEMRDTADSVCGNFQIGNNGDGAAAAAAATTPQPARGFAVKKVSKKKVAKKSTIVSSTKKVSTKKKGVKVSATDRNYDNKKTLGLAIWDILNRADWPVLKTVPEDALGLTAGEIKTMVLLEGDWKSAGADPANQISSQLGKFHHPKKAKGKPALKPVIARGDERRYYIIEGAKFPGKQG